ncbi:MAG: hypothetical protein WCX69_06105 [Candidatus Paceibacterota bacterium]
MNKLFLAIIAMVFLTVSSPVWAVQTASNNAGVFVQSNGNILNREAILNQIAAITKMIAQLQAQLIALNSASSPAIKSCPTICGQSASTISDGKGGKINCAATSACATVSTASAIPGLDSIRLGGAVWGDWTGDGKRDGVVIDVVYLDKDKDIISSPETRIAPISADVQIMATKCAGTNQGYLGSSSGLWETVFTAHYSLNQIALGGIYPEIRIPEGLLNVGRCGGTCPECDSTYYWSGGVKVTINIAGQGTFSATRDAVQLYKNLSECPSEPMVCSNR